MNCPKCGFQQNEGSECLRCGLIFSRFDPTPNPHKGTKQGGSRLQVVGSYFLHSYKIFRWITLAGLILAIALVLHNSKPPTIAIPSEAVGLAEDKIRQFQSTTRRGLDTRLELDQVELNGWLGATLPLKKEGNSSSVAPQKQASIAELAKTATGGHALAEASLQQAQSSIRDIKVELKDDLLHLYVIFDMYGMHMSMELEGRLKAEEGYLRLEPTGGRLGSFPLMAGTLQAVAARLFTSPENREKFKLPDYIQDVRVENGHLIVASH